MIYRVGDTVYYGDKDGGPTREAMIVKIDHEEEDANYKYCIRYKADFGREYSIWTGKDCFKGLIVDALPKECLKQELERLLNTFSKEEIISALEDM